MSGNLKEPLHLQKWLNIMSSNVIEYTALEEDLFRLHLRTLYFLMCMTMTTDSDKTVYFSDMAVHILHKRYTHYIYNAKSSHGASRKNNSNSTMICIIITYEQTRYTFTKTYAWHLYESWQYTTYLCFVFIYYLYHWCKINLLILGHI